MTKQKLKEKIIEIMQRDNCTDAYEQFAAAVFDSINSDDEPWHRIGYYLFKAILDDSVDDALIALCGWSTETLMVKAGLLSDTDHIFS